MSFRFDWVFALYVAGTKYCMSSLMSDPRCQLELQPTQLNGLVGCKSQLTSRRSVSKNPSAWILSYGKTFYSLRKITMTGAYYFRPALKRKCCHFDEILITDCTESCHFDNFRCSQWWKFRQNDDISVSVSYAPWISNTYRWHNGILTEEADDGCHRTS